jgi:hypothetical protein
MNPTIRRPSVRRVVAPSVADLTVRRAERPCDCGRPRGAEADTAMLLLLATIGREPALRFVAERVSGRPRANR